MPYYELRNIFPLFWRFPLFFKTHKREKHLSVFASSKEEALLMREYMFNEVFED